MRMEGYKKLLRIQTSAKQLIVSNLKKSYELTTTQIHLLLQQEYQWMWGIDLVIDFMLINNKDFRLLNLDNNDALWGLTDKHLEE